MYRFALVFALLASSCGSPADPVPGDAAGGDEDVWFSGDNNGGDTVGGDTRTGDMDATGDAVAGGDSVHGGDTFTGDTAASPGDIYEQDDTVDQAASLPVIVADGTGQTHDFADDAVDLVPVDCVAGSELFIQVVPWMNNTHEYIISPTGDEIAAFTHTGPGGTIEHVLNDRILWTCDATARRYIKVFNELGRVDPDDGYIIRVWLPVPRDPYEDDDTRLTAWQLGPVPEQGVVQADRTFFDDHTDWLAIDGQAASLYTITVAGIDDNVRPAAALYLAGEDYPLVSEPNFGATLTSVVLSAPLTTAGLLALEVTNGIHGADTRYSVTIARQSAGADDYYELGDVDTFSNNDELATAENVPLDVTCHFRFTHRTGTGQDDWDCVALSTVDGTSYTVSATDAVYDGTTDVTRVRLYDDVAAGQYSSIAQTTSTAGPLGFTAAPGTSYWLCFYSWISVDPFDDWADYTFTVVAN